MKKNTSKTDRLLRLIMVVVIIGLYAVNIVSGIFASIALTRTGIFLLTSLNG